MATTASQQQSTTKPQSLKAAYAAAEAQRKTVERGIVFPSGPGSNSNGDSRAAYGDAVTKALEAYEDCSNKVEALSLFSSNETLEDISTSHLPYLLVPYRVAELVQRVTTGAGGPAERQTILKRAREAYERFLHRLDTYEGLLSEPYTKLLQEYTDDPTHFSTVGNTGGGAITQLSGNGGGAAAAAALMDPAARRNAKIANFRAEKELRTKLEVLQQRQTERRERQRRQRQRIREAEGSGEKEGNTEEGEEEDDDDDDDDEEAARELYLAQISYCAHLAFQGLESLNREDEMLAQVAAMASAHGWPTNGSTTSAGGLGDSRQRQGGGATGGAFSERLEPIGAPTGDALRRLQSTFGNTVGTGALLTKDGKPRQPFTILGSRAEMAKNVFRPGHNLPTMSIDEYLEEERRRGGIIDGGGPSSGLKPEPDEDDMDKADAETMKARAWDEFTEANPKGAGNTLNRG